MVRDARRARPRSSARGPTSPNSRRPRTPGQRARERLDRCCSVRPLSVIYSSPRPGNEHRPPSATAWSWMLGYRSEEYLQGRRVLAEPCPSRMISPGVEAKQELSYSKAGEHLAEYVRNKDGSYCWVSDEQRPSATSTGAPLEVVGSWSNMRAFTKRPSKHSPLATQADLEKTKPGCDGGKRGQERLPRQYEPRDPHADERDHRHVAPAAQDRARRRDSATTAARSSSPASICSASSTTSSISRRSRPASSPSRTSSSISTRCSRGSPT